MRAIDAIRKHKTLYEADHGWDKTTLDALDTAIKALEYPHWIPCSERLPEKSGKYYVSGGNKVWICEFLVISNFAGGWCNDVANPMVQAWMPLPEPYREGDQMSVIVKGMEMPDSCAVCRFAGKGGYHMERVVCMFTGKNEDAKNVDRLSDCPLVALPDKHGRLVDADAFKADYGMKDDCEDCEKEMRGKVKACEYDCVYSKMDFCSWIDDADTIVEAEGD